MSARRAALRALTAVEAGGWSNRALDRELRRAALTPEDAKLATALCYGVLDRKRTLDYVIDPMLKGNGKLSPTVRNALRMGVYQLFYMDRVPDFAAVSETVELVKRSRDARAGGLVNALLRRLQREGMPSLPQERTAAALSVRASCEEWLCARLIADWGFDAAERLLTAAFDPSPLTLRVNPLRTTPAALKEILAAEGATAGEVEGLPLALRLTEGGVEGSGAYRRGLFHVQDAASQRCCAAVEARPGMAVLDLCAAPGGKTFTLAEDMQNTGRVTARDLSPARAGLIAEGAERLGLTCVTARAADAAVFDPALGLFDRVLCDVPCSGIGDIRRKPEIKYKPAFDAQALGRIQSAILSCAASYVAPGGRLIYSTCTLLKAENEAVTAAFLAAHDGFRLLGEPVLQWPGRAGDGFYYAVMERM